MNVLPRNIPPSNHNSISNGASLDFLAVGDITTDAFIRLKDAKVNCDLDESKCQICLSFGDKVPYEFAEVIYGVGNAANAAVAAAKLGLKSALAADTGDDEPGKKSREAMRKAGVETGYISLHHGIPSNYHFVLWYESERTILVKHEKFPRRFPDISPPKFLYLSSLGEDTAGYHLEIENYLRKHPDIQLVFQPGTFQIKLGLEKLRGIYERTSIFVANREEVGRILGIKTTDTGDLARKMRAEGPRLIVITDGPRGAYAYDGKELWFVPPYPDPKPPYQRTGAGDAFASTFTSAIILGQTIPEALRWGAVNSMSVVQQLGAQRGLLNRSQISKYLDSAPGSFKPKRII